jgi:prophage maintenance system killer protein
MEGIIKSCPIDGNKRRDLIETQIYLVINGYIPIFPVHVVEFSINIAKRS